MKRSLALISFVAFAAVASLSAHPLLAQDEELLLGNDAAPVQIPITHACPELHAALYSTFEDFIHTYRGRLDKRMSLYAQSEPGDDRSEVMAVVYHVEQIGDTWKYTRTILNLSAHTIDYTFFQPPTTAGMHQVRILTKGTLSSCERAMSTIVSKDAPVDRFDYVSLFAKGSDGKAVWVGKFRNDPNEDTMFVPIEGVPLPPNEDFK